MTEMELPFTELKLTVPWGHVAAKAYGSPVDKPVLMVHGHLDNAGSFTRLIQYLPMDYYYVCIDLPGHGRSSQFPSWQIFDFLDFIKSIHFVLEALQWKTCIYVGHSFGAIVGIFFSVLQPHRIRKIIAFDGLFPLISEEDFASHLEDMFTLSIKAASSMQSPLYSKEEVMDALQYKRNFVLCYDAAKVLFERAVTEVDGKYKYNRDIRLRKWVFTSITLNQCIQIVSKISVSLYLFVPSNGMLIRYSEILRDIIELLITKIGLKVINVKGNHDCHNNNPEIVASFVCKILNNKIISKL